MADVDVFILKSFRDGGTFHPKGTRVTVDESKADAWADDGLISFPTDVVLDVHSASVGHSAEHN